MTTITFVGDNIPDQLRQLVAIEARADGLGYVFVAAHDAEADTFDILRYRDEFDREVRLWMTAHRYPT